MLGKPKFLHGILILAESLVVLSSKVVLIPIKQSIFAFLLILTSLEDSLTLGHFDNDYIV